MTPTTQHPLFTSFLGIDISKDHVDCWLRPTGQYAQFRNDQSGINQLHNWLGDHSCAPETLLICMENTGIYGSLLLATLIERGWKCSQVKTTATRKVAPEHRRKDDRFDAQLLAEYADRYQDRIPLSTPPDPVIEQLRQLYSERGRLIGVRRAAQNKLSQLTHAINSPQMLEQSLRQQRAFYNGQIALIEADISRIIEHRPGLRHYYQLLRGIPGIGQVTAWLWLILFYGQSHLDPKHISSRFGFAPHRHISGSSVRGKTRSSGHGQAQMRASMTMVARSVSYHYPSFAAYKERKLQEGKPWPVIRNNVINKLITLICAIWNTGQVYNPEHISRYDKEEKVA